MSILVTLAGVAPITFALRDIFDTLFRTSGKGMFEPGPTRLLWRPARWVVVRYDTAGA